jgi:hypothetical protein
MIVAAVTVAAVAELTAVAVTTMAVTTASTMAAIVVVVATVTVGGPVQDLTNFQMAQIPFLIDLTCSAHSPHAFLKV